MSTYGPLITDTRVENRVRDQLAGWLPSYLVEVARQDGFGAIALPKSIETIRDRVTKWTEQALPAIIVQVAGTIGVARKGSGYRVAYGATIGAVVAGQSRQNTRDIAGIYALAITAALCQHGDLDGFADGCDWTATDYDYIDEDRSRTIMAAVVSLDIAVNQVLDVYAGPSGPAPLPTDPPIPGLPDYGHVATTVVEEVLVPLDQPLETT